jgi:hypothetical protein
VPRSSAQDDCTHSLKTDGADSFVATIALLNSTRPICKSADHLFVPILEVNIPLLRCIHCDVFAYHETVKQLAKNRRYRVDDEEPVSAPAVPYWRKLWSTLKRRFAPTGPREARS